VGLPRISDGQLLFLQHMLSHTQSPEDEGSRVAIIMNGSPLFTGDAGGGESEIQRWILEQDWLEALVALPVSTAKVNSARSSRPPTSATARSRSSARCA